MKARAGQAATRMRSHAGTSSPFGIAHYGLGATFVPESAGRPL
ncbi:hypothetical protein [Streptomyces albogriseolus]